MGYGGGVLLACCDGDRQSLGVARSSMRSSLACAAAAALLVLPVPSGAQAVTLDQACQKFAGKLSAAQASGDKQKTQTVYTEGSKRIAKKFKGATCPNVKAPTP